MKTFLILLNISLLCGIFWSILDRARMPNANEDEYFFRKAEKEKVQSAKKEKTEKPAAAAEEKLSSEEAVRKITVGNIFDASRCPNARIPGRRNGNTKLEMTLVGTFVIGNLSGAVILQKKQQQNTFMTPFPWMQGPPMMQPQGNANNASNGNRNNDNRRRRFNPFDMMRMQQNQTGSSEEKAVVYQQYVRVGETLANGYKLTAVTRTSATLTKNSEKLELELVEASKNAGAASNKNTSQSSGRMPGMMPGMMMPPPGMGGFGGGQGGRWGAGPGGGNSPNFGGGQDGGRWGGGPGGNQGGRQRNQ